MRSTFTAVFLAACIGLSISALAQPIDQIPIYGGADRSSDPSLRAADEKLTATPPYDARKEVACLGALTDKCLSELRNECKVVGGRWEGQIIGRGRTWGCNLPTKDAGKSCAKMNECESACVPKDSHSESPPCHCAAYMKQPKGALTLCTDKGVQTYMVD